MSNIKIINQKQFLDWLDDNYWLDDGYCRNVEPFPKTENEETPTEATIDLAYQIEGTYEAYSKVVYRVFRLHLKGLLRYSIPEGGEINYENCMDGIDAEESAENIEFSFSAPAWFRIACKSMVIEQLPDAIETVKPWLSERDFWIEVSRERLPTPEEWVLFYGSHGQDVSWHLYGGEARKPEEVPENRYQGWFLQDKVNLDQDHQGICFNSCGKIDDGFRITFENHKASDELWQITKLIAGQFENVEIHCGNCKFTRSKWLKQLEKQE